MRQGLVGAGHHSVGAQRHRMRGQVGVEAEVGRPGGVDDEWDAVVMRGVREPSHVTDGADVGGIADENGSGVRVFGEGSGDGCGRDTEWQAGRGVDLGADPDRGEPGEDQAEQHRAVQGAADDDPIAVAGYRQGEGLIGVGGAAGGEPAYLGAPEVRRASLRVEQDSGRELHGVQARVEGHVARDDIADEVVALLVAGDRKGGWGLLVKRQPGVEEWCVRTQPARVSRHRGSRRTGRRQGRG